MKKELKDQAITLDRRAELEARKAELEAELEKVLAEIEGLA